MIWFLERGPDLLICEIRRADHNAPYEFEITAATGTPMTRRFTSPTELINSYLREHTQLRALGWRPRGGDLEMLN